MMNKVVEISIDNGHCDPQIHEPIDIMDVADEFLSYDYMGIDRSLILSTISCFPMTNIHSKQLSLVKEE